MPHLERPYSKAISHVISVLVPFTDWAHNAHSLTIQRGQNAHYNYAQFVKGRTVSLKPGRVTRSFWKKTNFQKSEKINNTARN